MRRVGLGGLEDGLDLEAAGVVAEGLEVRGVAVPGAVAAAVSDTSKRPRSTTGPYLPTWFLPYKATAL